MRRPGSGTGKADGESLTRKAECEGEGNERATANEKAKKRSHKEWTQAHGRGEEKKRMTAKQPDKERTLRTIGKQLREPEKTAIQERVEKRRAKTRSQ